MDSTIGVVADIVGLTYSSGNILGITDAHGRYAFDRSATVSFSIGDLLLCTIPAKPVLTFADLSPCHDQSLTDPRLINRARILLSLSPSLGFETPIVISDTVCRTELTKGSTT